MFEVLTSSIFDAWLAGLRDRQAVQRVLARIDRARAGNLGDAKCLRNGVNEMRISHGPGYRVYFTYQAKVLVILLCGGDKSSQDKDIEKAIELVQQLKMED